MSDVPIIRYGGKGSMASRIYPHFAAAKVYLEPFFGGGGMFFQIPRRHWDVFVVNDLEDRVVNFFRQLRDSPRELTALCSLTPYSRVEFQSCTDEALDPLEDARRFFVLATQAFNGAYSTGAWSSQSPAGNPKEGRVVQGKAANLHSFAQRLSDVAIEHKDAIDLVAKYAAPSVFIYSDPPYVHATRTEKTAYLCEMTDAQHTALAESHKQAVAAGAKVCISGYAGELYEELYKGWRTADIEVQAVASGNRGGKVATRTERLWLSYPAEEEIGHNANHFKPRTPRERQLLKALR